MRLSAANQRDIVTGACAISAGIHAALVREHFGEGAGAGAGFVASAVLLAALVVVLIHRPSSLLAIAASAAVLAGLLASYALAATTGVPLLHPQPEPVEGLALATKTIEAIGLIAALRLLGRRRPVVAGVIQAKGAQT